MNAAAITPQPQTQAPVRVLVVDDEMIIQKAWRAMLGTSEFEVATCSNGMEALQILNAQRIDVVIADVMMPGINGLELLDRIKQKKREIEVIIMTAKGSIPDAVTATKGGAFDYITKPFNEVEECINKVRQAARLKRLHDENLALRQQVEASPNGALLDSQSPVMRPVLNRVAHVSKVNSSVLITGPTGSGKSLVARAIHEQSRRNDGPFVHVDCGSIPSELIESELFGHQKGAFTGAVSDKEGLFEVADGGTIFLDEIGNMPMPMQQRLLRVLQESRVRRVGGSRDINVDVRVLSATNADLPAEVEQGHFREDLFFRLKVVEIRIPGLNERREDIPRLAYHFLRRTSEKIGKEVRTIAPGCMEVLKRHDWKGNVRELENVIEAALVFEGSDELSEENLPPELAQGGGREGNDVGLGGFAAGIDLDLPFRDALDQVETSFRVAYLRGVMDRYRNVTAAAEHAQMDRANFRRMLKRYEITNYPRGEVRNGD
jgi:two-component system response regulator HydG